MCIIYLILLYVLLASNNFSYLLVDAVTFVLWCLPCVLLSRTVRRYGLKTIDVWVCRCFGS